MPTRILCVDDELPPPGMLKTGCYMLYYTEALRMAGFELIEARGVDEAVAEVKKLSSSGGTVDLMLLNICMPRGTVLRDENDTHDGLETGAFLADILADILPGVPIVFLTNHGDPALHREPLRKPPVREVLMKVMTPPLELVDELQRVLGKAA